MAPELRCLLLLTLLGWGGGARTARRVNATESKVAVLPCAGPSAGDRDPPTQFAHSWLWKDPWGRELLRLNATLGKPLPRARTAIGGRGSLVLPNVTTSDAGVYACQWDQADRGAVLLNVPGSRKLYVSGTLGGHITLPCTGGNASETPAVDWFRDNGTHLLVRDGPRHRPNGSFLLIDRLGPDDTGWYWCRARNQNWTVHLSLGGELSVSVLVGATARLPCDGSMPDAWVHGSLSWARRGPDGSWKRLVVLEAQRKGNCTFQLTLGTGAALVLPAVTSAQAGTYLCVSGNASNVLELGVTPHAGGWQPWIVGAAELGYIVLGLASLFGYCQIRRALQTRRRSKHLMDPARRFFKVTANGAQIPYGNVLPPTGPAGVGQTDAVPYENVGLGTRRQGRPPPADGLISPIESEDEEEYEHPDSEAELAPEDGEGYENTNGDMKVGDKRLSDETCYENSLEESRAGGAPHYTNARQGPEAEDLVSEDGECYENEEDSAPMSPGAARLITDLRLLLLGACDEPGRDRPDGHSEGSVGSQAYEEMAGALYAAPARHLRFRDCSQEEDADSYENMEEGPGFLPAPSGGERGAARRRGRAQGPCSHWS